MTERHKQFSALFLSLLMVFSIISIGMYIVAPGGGETAEIDDESEVTISPNEAYEPVEHEFTVELDGTGNDLDEIGIFEIRYQEDVFDPDDFESEGAIDLDVDGETYEQDITINAITEDRISLVPDESIQIVDDEEGHTGPTEVDQDGTLTLTLNENQQSDSLTNPPQGTHEGIFDINEGQDEFTFEFETQDDAAFLEPTVDGETSVTVEVDEEVIDIDVLVVNEDGEIVPEEDIELTNIDSTGPTVNGASEGQVEESNSEDGEAVFSDISFSDETGSVTFQFLDTARNANVGEITIDVEDTHFQFDVVSTPDDVPEGETVELDTLIWNSGDVDGTQTVTWDANELGEDSKEVFIESGETESVTLTIDTAQGDAGTYSDTTVSTEDDTEDVGLFEVLEPAEYTVDIIDTNDPVDEGEDLDVTAEIENVGEADGSQEVTLDAEELGVDSSTVEVPGGETEQETFTVSTESGDAGDYTATVESDDDEDSQLVTVEEVSADSVSVETHPGESTAGESIEGPPEAIATDSNGDPVENVEVTVAETGGYNFDSPSESVTADTGSDGVATFDDLVIEEAGSYELEFSIDGDDDNVETDDTSDPSDSFEVTANDADDIEIITAPDQITAGDSLSLTIEVEDEFDNTAENQDLDNVVVDSEFDNEVYSENEVSLDGNGQADLAIDADEVTTADDQHTLTADADGISDDGTTDINIDADDPDVIEVTPIEDTAKADDDEQLEYEVTVEDQYENPKNLDVEVTHNGSGITFPDGDRRSTGDDGTTIFTMTSDEVQTVEFDFEEQETELESSEIGSFEADDPDSIDILEQPAETVAGEAIEGPPEVLVTDDVGNPVPDEDVEVSEVGNYDFDAGTETVTTDDGIAVFDDLEIHEADSGYELEFEADGVTERSVEFEVTAAPPESVEPTIDGESTPDVPVDIEQNIDVLVEDQYGNEVTGEDVEVDNIQTTGQTEVENLNVGKVLNTETDGQVTFEDVIFTGEAPEDATITFETENEETGDLEVDVLVGEVDSVTPRIDEEQDPTVAVGADNDVVVTVRDTSENLVDDEDVHVRSIDDSQVEEITGIDESSSANTGSNGNATFYDVEFIGEDGAEASIVFENETGDVAGTITVTLETGDADSVEVETEPDDTVAGEPIEGPPAGVVTDAGGNPVEDVTVSVSETGDYEFDSEEETTTVDTDSLGVAAFDELVIEEAMEGYELEFEIEESHTNVDQSDTAISEQFTVESANATSVLVGGQPTETTAGDTIQQSDDGSELPLTASVEDEYGNPVGDVDISVMEDSGYEIDAGTLTETTTDDGEAVFFSLIIETTGTYNLNYTIHAEDDNVETSDHAVTDDFDVVPADPAELAYDQQPTNATAGEFMRPNVTLQILDEFGNVVPDEPYDVALEVSEGEGTLKGTLDLETIDGVVKFADLRIEQADTYRVFADSEEVTLDEEGEEPFTAESDNFTVSPAEPHNLTILTQPENAVAGETIPGLPEIELRDEYDNLIRNESVRVTVPGGSIDDGTTVLDTDENGTAVYDDLEIREAGTYELYFDVVDYETNGTSEEFTIEHAGIHSVTPTINANPTPTVTARVPQTVAVSVQDEFENPIPGEQVSFDALDTGEDEFNVTGLDAGNSTATTTERGEALFNNVIFNGTESQTVDLTFSAATTSGTMDVTLEEPIEGFVVEISHTNSPVQVADSLTVTAGIVNTDDEQHTQSVEFTVGPFSDSETITLEPDESTQTTFTWNVGPADRGSHLAEVSSEDDADNTTVTVFADPPAFESGHVPEDAPESVFATFDDDVFIHEDADETAGFSVTADGSAVEVAGASTDGQELELTLAESIEYEQSVVFGYDGESGTLVNEHGVEAEVFESVELENHVPEPLEANLSALDPETGERTDRLSVDVTMEQGVIFSAADSLLPTGAEVTYEWQIGDETFTTDEPELSEEFLEPGIYNATLSIFADDRTSSAEFSLEVVDETPPDVQLSALDSVNVGDDPELDASESTDNVAIAEYQWDFGDGETTSGAELTNPEHAFDEAGEYEVTVTVVDTSGNTESETVTVEVEESGGVADVNPAPVGAFLLFAAVIGGVYYYYRRFH